MELIIEACEGGLYIAKLTEDNHSHRWLRTLCQRHGLAFKANMRFHNLSHIRDYFSSLAPEKVWLIHNNAYDQMIGLPSASIIDRQSLHWYSASTKSSSKLL